MLEREVEQDIEMTRGAVIAFAKRLGRGEGVPERLLGFEEVLVHPGPVRGGEWRGREAGGEQRERLERQLRAAEESPGEALVIERRLEDKVARWVLFLGGYSLLPLGKLPEEAARTVRRLRRGDRRRRRGLVRRYGDYAEPDAVARAGE